MQARLQEIASGQPVKVPATMLQLLNQVCFLSFKINNVICLHEHSLPALKDFVECFLAIAFDESAINEFLFNGYLHTNEEGFIESSAQGQTLAKSIDLAEGAVDAGKVGSLCEDILSHGICFPLSVLENPVIFNDVVPDCNPDEEHKQEESKGGDGLTAEQYVEQRIFHQDRLRAILTSIVMKYLLLN